MLGGSLAEGFKGTGSLHDREDRAGGYTNDLGRAPRLWSALRIRGRVAAGEA